MIYLTDFKLETIPEDAARVVWIGIQWEEIPEGYESLEPHENDMVDQGAKVQFWHQRNGFCEFKLLTVDKNRYGLYVNAERIKENGW